MHIYACCRGLLYRVYVKLRFWGWWLIGLAGYRPSGPAVRFEAMLSEANAVSKI